MKAFHEKLQVIQDLMMGVPLPPSFSDLDEAECLFMASTYNVRFKKTATGYMCFFSSRPGLSGMGESRIRAFIFMLNNLGFKRDPNLEFLDQMDGFFNNLT